MVLLGLLGILVGLGLLIWLSYRGWSVLVLAPLAARADTFNGYQAGNWPSPTLSNSTAAPTASNIRGSTLTRTPTALATRISSATSFVSTFAGARMILCTRSSVTT